MILASQSPRRIELMREAGYDIRVIPADIDETPFDGEAPLTLVERLARAKAAAVAAEHGESAGQASDQAEPANATAEQAADAADAAAEAQAEVADAAEPAFAIPDLPAFDVDYGTWGIEYADGSVREFDAAAGAFS